MTGIASDNLAMSSCPDISEPKEPTPPSVADIETPVTKITASTIGVTVNTACGILANH